MPRRGAKAPSSNSGLTGGSVTVVSGSIRTPDETDALSVKLSIWDTEITMRVDGAELGNWDASEVRIRAIDSTSFEFVAEGDQLVFTPDDPSAFVSTSLVKGRVSGGGRKKRRKDKKKTEQAPAAIVVPEPSFEMDGGRGKRRSAEKARPAKPSRRERKAAAKESAARAAAEADSSALESPAPMREPTVRRGAVPTPIGRHPAGSGAGAERESIAVEEAPAVRIPAFRELEPEPAAVPDPGRLPEPEPAPVAPSGRVESPPPELSEVELVEPPPQVEPGPAGLPEAAPRQKRSRLKRSERKSRADELAPSEPAPDEPEESEEPAFQQPNRLWIRALDLARKYDFLGLDRVPVNESLRGQEHQHTWDHRVAPSSGPGKYICTICGEIRR